jgi:predicted nuclease of restriction endonuclease-like (RecB) superfamily
MSNKRKISRSAEEGGEPLETNGPAPKGYAQFLKDLKGRISTARTKAFLSVNRELVQLYWDTGKGIVERQRRDGWGKGIVDRLSTDIQREFPGIRGVSSGNIWRMRSFDLAWTEEVSILAQPVRELDETKPSQAVRESCEEGLSKPATALDGENLPQAVAEIPWSHNIILIAKLDNPRERLWYARMTIEHGWSRAVLVYQIERGLYHTRGKAITNFERTLPPRDSDMAQHTMKAQYFFDFVTSDEDPSERVLEKGLVDNIRKFLLELGTGFAFVGSQYHLEVDGEDFYIDLLFYHLRLRCFVAIDLKTGGFKPEYAGKMNFYLSVLDDKLMHPDDNPSIGIILCKTKKKVIAEYALRNTSAPIGVSEYRLTRKIPAELRANLPSIEELEKKMVGRK